MRRANLLSCSILLLVLQLSPSATSQELTERQRSLAGRYASLEQILFRLAETSAASNPRQAALLRTALEESREKLIVHRLDTLSNTLERRQFGDAITEQAELEQDLRLLLQILENVNRDEAREREKEALQELLKEVEELLYNERMLLSRTQRLPAQELPSLQQEQHNIRMNAQALQEALQEALQHNPEQTLQRAVERMQAAEQQLQQANRQAAIDEQEDAIAELQRLREELERILRQLREEELIQTLEKLEVRFRRMLLQEQAIRYQTAQLAEAQKLAQATDRDSRIRTDQLALAQQSVIDDAEAALMLLREDGTAQAMVEALLQARFDMLDVKARLEDRKLDDITLLIIDSIIDSLQEMLQAVHTAMEEARERQEDAQNQQGQPQDGASEAGEEPLIQLISELRMIRSMQHRINERTARYDEAIRQALADPAADLSALRAGVEELARQQNRLSRILHEIRIGRIH